jgi:hypothetical protein
MPFRVTAILLLSSKYSKTIFSILWFICFGSLLLLLLLMQFLDSVYNYKQ